MVVSALPRDWFRALEVPAQEFGLTELPILAGSIPAGLQGSLYRNGPARFDRGGVRVGHWFDGDGAVLAVHLQEGKAQATYRYVQTPAYQAETAAGRYLYANYGMFAPGSWLERWGQPIKNAGNTSVLALADRVLALCEAGQPFALDPDTLEFQGSDSLGGIPEHAPYSAHPKRDPLTGEIFNFGVSYGATATLHLYRSHSSGGILKQERIPLTGMPLIHDFVLAGPYLIFFIPPVRVDLLTLLLRRQPFGEALTWKPQLGTEVLVIDRDSLSPIARGVTDPWFQWHFGNGWVDPSGQVSLTLCRYTNWDTHRFLQEVTTGSITTRPRGDFAQVQLDPHTAQVRAITPLIPLTCDFPMVAAHQIGQGHRWTVLLQHRDELAPPDLLNTLVLYDHQYGSVTRLNFGPAFYPSEPILVTDPADRDQGWILTVVLDVERLASEVWILEAYTLNPEPICRLGLPQMIPPGFHGTWIPR